MCTEDLAWLIRLTIGRVYQVERNHTARTNGAYPTFEAEVASAKEASSLQTYREWLVDLKAAPTQ
jgi:hypothetical protein